MIYSGIGKRTMNLKTMLKIIAISTLFVLASCRATITAPEPTYKAPDVLSKATKTALVQETQAEIPCDVIIQTPETTVTHVTLARETVASVKISDEVFEERILPKNTEIVLPEKTPIQTVTSIPVNMSPQTEIILPNGTEITIRKVNWYALLFYCSIIFGAAWWYIKTRTKDVNNDGFEDSEKKINKKKE